MLASTTIQYLVLHCWLLASVVGQTCPFEECACVEDVISCEKRGLTAIPPMTSKGPFGHRFLKMETNNITNILGGELPPNLLEIDLSDNPVYIINIDSFDDSQDTLETLSFSEARFTRIPDVLLHVQSLKLLSILDTKIADWNEDVMKHIALTLQRIYLVNVGFHTWPTWLQNFDQLVELSLDSNSLSSIPDDGLDMVVGKLASLILSNNSFTTIPKAVSRLTALQSLTLDNNRILFTNWLPLSSSLFTLSLINTHLVDSQSLSKDLRLYADTLTDIVLDHNNLAEIPDFSFLSQIDSLDLSSNRISNPRAGALHPSITYLNLDNNFLSSIPSVFFNQTTLQSITMISNVVRQIVGTDIPVWITYVDLSYNLITELTDTCFPINSTITSLTLTGNPIVTISQNAFTNVPQIQTLILQYSKLTRLPLALASLTKVTWFDISGSLALVCTCQEKSIGSWFLSRQTSIDGKCGEASIAFFFQNLSPSCP